MTGTIALPPGLMIAAPRSGAGKTTVTLGLLSALRRRGSRVQAFKCGPDYIDPAFHVAASGRPSFNIDSWAMRLPVAAGLLRDGSAEADIVVVEALMGLFDGVSGQGHWGTGASADLAAVTGWPVVLVLDVSGQSQTAAATACGFRGFRDRVDVAGVILNRVGSERHVRLATEGLEAVGLKVFGALPRKADLVLPERHLGLVQAEETQDLSRRLDALAELIEANVDVPALIASARPGVINGDVAPPMPPPGQRIALARDAAFSFVYPHLIAGWRAEGAEIIPFSPLADEAPDDTADVVWLPGGYPELHAGTLANAARFKAGVRTFANTRPLHGECGGYMALGAGLVDASGARHEMIGLFGLETSFENRKMQLGYRRAEVLADCLLGQKGQIITGHEFHYATILNSPDAPLFHMQTADGETLAHGGSRKGHVTGSFFHVIDV
jgi:cobyrinic acid a,c-diamide synthase